MSSRNYLYGRSDAAVWAMVRDPVFKKLLSSLWRAGVARPASPEEEDAAARAAGLGLLRAAGGGFRPANLVAVPRAASLEAAERMAPAMERYAAIAREAAGRLREAFAKTAAARRFTWPEAEHAVVAGMLLDLSVGSRLHLDGFVERAYDETVIWAFEEQVGRNYFGVQWVAAEGRSAGLAQLWHGAVLRPALKISPAAVGALAGLAFGGSEPEPRDRLLLRYLGLIADEGAGDRPAAATFGAGEMEDLLLPILWRAAEQLVSEAVAPALAAGAEAAFWRDHEDGPNAGHALVRAALERGAAAGGGGGALTPFPVGRPAVGWGRWLWCEAEGLASPAPPTLVAGAFPAREALLAGAEA